MAGDWIKMRVNLDSDPRVVAVAVAVDLDEIHVVGCLHKLWSWADQHSLSGNALSVTEKFIDRVTRVNGFAAALRSVDWLSGEDGNLSFPGFERHNGQTAKARAQTARRAVKSKAKKRAESNAKGNGASVTKALTREEKRREEDYSTTTTTTTKAAEPGQSSDRKIASGGEWPAQGDVLKLVGSTAYPLTQECAEAYWLDREAMGWARNGQAIANWRADLQRYASHWMNNERNKKNEGTRKFDGLNSGQNGRNAGRASRGSAASAAGGAGAGISVPTL